jgi:cytochrome c1
MLRAFTAAAAVVVIAATGAAFAAGETTPPLAHNFSFESPIGNYDMRAVQRGWQVYAQVCSNCHALEHLSYRNLGEEGGPFAKYMERDEATGDLRPREVPGPPEHGGEFVEVTNNQWVRAIAAAATISDIDPNTGQPADRPGRISDHIRRPFPNEAASRASNGGAYPPDLSVITSARAGGARYVRSILMGYTGETRGTLHGNRFFPGGMIAMPPPLADGAVAYTDGSPTTVEQYATDVATFLQWAADPHMEVRKRTGIVVLAFLLALSGLLFLSYKAVWRNESH